MLFHCFRPAASGADAESLQMMRSKRANRTPNDELSNATAAAAEATELVDRKRKAASAASQDFELASHMTRIVTEP
jgi:hypothetical protein